MTSPFYFDQRFDERVNRIAPHTANLQDGIYDIAARLPLVALSPIPTFEFTAGIHWGELVAKMTRSAS